MDKDAIDARLASAVAINIAAIGEITAAQELLEENGNGNGGDPDYWPKIPLVERKRIHAMRFYPGLNMHFMGLQGWIYRNLKHDRKKTIDHVYEMFRPASSFPCTHPWWYGSLINSKVGVDPFLQSIFWKWQ